MDAKLFVGNLAYTATEDDLKALFTEAGEVKSVAVIKDRETGRSKGFAFVEFATPENAEKAISMFNGKEFQGRIIKVNVARPREDKPRRSFKDRRNHKGNENRQPGQDTN